VSGARGLKVAVRRKPMAGAAIPKHQLRSVGNCYFEIPGAGLGREIKQRWREWDLNKSM